MNRLFFVLFIFLTASTLAASPQQMLYQGEIDVNGEAFSGNLEMKFVLHNDTQSLWSHDGSGNLSTEPNSSIEVAVDQGLYSVALGDTNSANMQALNSFVLGQSDLKLRVWVNGGSNFQLMSPDKIFYAVPFAQSVVQGHIENSSANLSALKLGALVFPTSDGSNGQFLSTDGSGTLSWASSSSANIGNSSVETIHIASQAITSDKLDSNLSITGNLTVAVSTDMSDLTVNNSANISGFLLPTTVGSVNQILVLDSSGQLNWENQATSSSNQVSSSFDSLSESGANILMSGNLSVQGSSNLSGLLYPQTDGSANQFLSTDGNGVLFWIDASTGLVSSQGNTEISGNLIVVGDLVYDLFTNRTTDTSFGLNAMGAGNLSSGTNNSAFGDSALFQITSGYQNTALGQFALKENTTGYNNTAIGASSLRVNQSGYANVAQGYRALDENTTGYHNTANGANALRRNTTGVYNTAVGSNSLSNNTAGSNHVGVGLYSLQNLTGGNNNVGVGFESFRYLAQGNNNVALGSDAGRSLTSGDNNIFIGYDVQPSSSSVSDELNIADILIGDLANMNLSIAGNLSLTGAANLSGLVFPTTTGSVNQVLLSDGNGMLTWGNQSSSNISSVDSSVITDGSIQAVDIADGTITLGKLGNIDLHSGNIVDGSIQAVDIADGTITLGKLGSIDLHSGNIVDGSIQAVDIADGTITLGKLGSIDLHSGNIVDGSIQATDIADGTITLEKLSSIDLHSGNIVNGTIATVDIADGAITTAKLGTVVFTAANLGVDSVTSSQITDGTVSNNDLAGSIDPSKITNTAATLSGSETLTNKTLNSPVINSPTITSLMLGDDLNVSGNIAASVNLTASQNLLVSNHDGSTTGLFLGGTLVTSVALELNVLDGITSTTTELNKLDGVTSTTAELNYLAGVTAGTSSASKALVVDANQDISGLRDISLTGKITGSSNIYGLIYPTSDGASGQVLSTDGSGSLGWTTLALSSASNLSIAGNFLRSDSTVESNGVNDVNLGFSSTVGSTDSPNASYATVAGGFNNTSTNTYSFVGGGQGNDNNGKESSILGGLNNSIYGGEVNTIAGGTSNEIFFSTQYMRSFIGAGFDNEIHDAHVFVGAGKTNKVLDGQYSSIVSGLNNTINVDATSNSSMIGAGTFNEIFSDFSFIGSSYYASANLYGSVVQSSGPFVVERGSAQSMKVILRQNTTNTSVTSLYLDGISKRLTIPEGAAWAFDMKVIAKQVGTSDTGVYVCEGGICNNSGTVTLEGAATVTELHDDIAATVSVSADDANDALQIDVQAGSAVDIRWVAEVEIVQVIHN